MSKSHCHVEHGGPSSLPLQFQRTKCVSDFHRLLGWVDKLHHMTYAGQESHSRKALDKSKLTIKRRPWSGPRETRLAHSW